MAGVMTRREMARLWQELDPLAQQEAAVKQMLTSMEQGGQAAALALHDWLLEHDHTPSAALQHVCQTIAPRDMNLYQRARVVTELLDNYSWIYDQHRGREQDAEEALARRYFPDLSQLVRVRDLVEMIHLWPDEAEWSSAGYDLRILYIRYRSHLEARQKKEREASPYGRRERGPIPFGEARRDRLPLASLRIDPGLQVRVAIDPATVEEYTQLLCDSHRFQLPAVAVFRDGTHYYLADGFHRLEAYRKACRGRIPCDVREGTRRLALAYALSANTSHGLRRSNADKRRAVEMALADEEWGHWSNGQLARLCGVSHTFVSNLRASLATVASETSSPSPSERTYTTRHGTQATMRTGNIGHGQQQAQPAPAVEIADEPEPAQADMPLVVEPAVEPPPPPPAQPTPQAAPTAARPVDPPPVRESMSRTLRQAMAAARSLTDQECQMFQGWIRVARLRQALEALPALTEAEREQLLTWLQAGRP